MAKALKGFDDRYILLQYETPASHVLITPNACLVFTVKMQGGVIQYQRGKWKSGSRFRNLFLWLASDNLGNPLREVEIELHALSRYLTKQLPEMAVPLQPVILFGNPNAQIDANESPVPAVHAKKLKDWLRGPGKTGSLDSATHDKIVQLLVPESQDLA